MFMLINGQIIIIAIIVSMITIFMFSNGSSRQARKVPVSRLLSPGFQTVLSSLLDLDPALRYNYWA